MNPVIKLAHVLSWLFVILVQTFPLLMVKLFIDISWLWAFAPVGLLFLGAIIIPFALLFNTDMKKFPLYGNKEEGYPAWFDRYAQNFWYKKVFPRWWWFVIRNPLNNIRFLFDDSKPFTTIGWDKPSMEAHDLIAAGVSSATRWNYRGAMAGYRRVWLNDDGETYGEVWVGWKVGSKVPGLGFATSYRPRATIGQ